MLINDADILKGIRVLDFTRVLAGPYATRVLADFGAEVIKVEQQRSVQEVEEGRDAYFQTWNRNKQSITVNMGHPDGRSIIKRLVRVCDVLVENFSPRVMSNWDLSYDELKGVKPDLIMLSMSGFGQTGPWRDYVAYAPTVQALGGLMYLTAHKEEEPLGPGFAYGDIMAGLYGAFALLGALENRNRTGEGQFIDLSEYEVICSLIGASLNGTTREEVTFGNCADNDSITPCGCYQSRGEDQWLVLAVNDETEWEALCDIIDPSLKSDNRFKSQTDRRGNQDKLDEIIEQWTRRRPAHEAVEIFQKGGIPAGVVQDAQEVAEDPQHLSRKYFVKTKTIEGHPLISDRTPLWHNYDVSPPWKGAPTPGASNHYVFREILGMSEEEYQFNVKKGVIG